MKRQIFLIIVFISYMGCANAQWQQTNLDNIEVMAFGINGTDIYAGSNSSDIFLSSDNGNTWTAKNDGLPAMGTTVRQFCISGNNIFVGGGFGVYLSTNNGDSWTAMNDSLKTIPTGNQIFVNALIKTKNYLIAGTDNRGIYVYSDNGINWTWTTPSPYNTLHKTIFALVEYESNIFAGTMTGVWMTSDNGISSTQVNTGLLSYDWVMSLAISGSNIFAGTNENGAFLSSNNGGTWTKISNKHVNSFAISGTDIFAGTDNDGVYWSSDNGSNWTKVNTGLPSYPFFSNVNALAISGNTLFASVSGKGVWKRSLSDITVGIKEIVSTESHIEVYPNPVKDKMIIISQQKSDMELISIQGQKILQQQLNWGKTDIDISGLAKGIYILKLSIDKKTEVTQIVKE